MKRVYRILGIAWLLLAVCFVGKMEAKASEQNENVSVTVPSNLQIVFLSDGTNMVSDFEIENQSVVPIHITNVVVTPYNGWRLASKQEEIRVNQKKLAFVFRDKCLQEGENLLQLTIPEQTKQNIDIQIFRGAWSKECPKEKAFEMSFEYSLGTKDFQLTLLSTEESVERVSVCNGEVVKLSVPERMKYEFLGWEDEEGRLYKEEFLMPMHDVKLTAKWQWQEAYAIYSSADKMLRFVRSSTPIAAGEIYRGQKVDVVYTGIEDDTYTSRTVAPWTWGGEICQVEVVDYIQPVSTAYWFYALRQAHTFDLRKLDTSRTVNMTSMFSDAGGQVTDTVTVRGLQSFDTSNVRYMGAVFRYLGRNAKTVIMDDVSGWNTASVEDMGYVFCMSFQKADVYVDCSKWDTSSVTDHENFTMDTGGTVIEPKWAS